LKAASSYRFFVVLLGLLVLALFWKPLTNRFSESGNYKVTYTLTTDTPGTFDVYFDTGSGWTEHNKVGVDIDSPVTQQVITFPRFPSSRVEHIRIDAGGALKKVRISDVQVTTAVDRQSMELSNPKNYGHCLSSFIDGDEIELITECEDAYLEMDTDLSGLRTGALTSNDYILRTSWILLCTIFSVALWRSRPFADRFARVEVHTLLMTCLFVGIIASHWILTLSEGLRVDPTIERRYLAFFPELDTSSFTSDFELWFEDHYAGRQLLTNQRSSIAYNFFKKSAFPNKVVLGKNMEMFPTPEFLIDDLKGEMRLDVAQLQSVLTNIKERIAFMKRSGRAYYLVIPPNKQTIYTDELPLKFHPESDSVQTMVQQVMEYIKRDPEVLEHTIDLSSALKDQAAESHVRLFYKNDIHWNGYGAYYGYHHFMSHLSKYHKELTPFSLAQFNVQEMEDNEGDLARQLLLHESIKRKRYIFSHKDRTYDREDIKTELYMPVQRILTDQHHLPKVLVFRDSFWKELIPLMSPHFSNALYVWDPMFDIDLIKEERPDIVIHEIAELFMLHLLSVNPPAINDTL